MDGKTYNNIVGKRLSEVRKIFNEGGEIPITQFAFLLSESRDKLSNYENGRSAIPIKLLHELYIRGINPIYILSGEGEVFADNNAGEIFRAQIKKRIESEETNKHKRISDEKIEYLKVAAGIIPRPKIEEELN